MSRRKFLQTSAVATAATASGLFAATAQDKKVNWPIGCFNRPWMQAHGTKTDPVSKPMPANWGYDVALKGMKEAGYKLTGLLTRMPMRKTTKSPSICALIRGGFTELMIGSLVSTTARAP